MTRHKDLKRLVRARMLKTGEAYTAARAQILNRPVRPAVTAVPPPASAPRAAAKIDYAGMSGFSDKAIKENTGCTWERWVHALDAIGAETMRHRELAALIHDKYKVDGWWAQAVTTGYERIKGRRAIGQRVDGSYEASKSRTFDVPVATLFDAWANPRRRRRWMNGERLTLRTATAPKSLRLGRSDGSIVAVWFTALGAARSSVAIAQGKLGDRATVDRVKQYWSERLDALGETLGSRLA
jgi:hypothetical protein